MFTLNKNKMIEHMERFIEDQWLQPLDVRHSQTLDEDKDCLYYDSGDKDFLQTFRPIYLMLEDRMRDKFEEHYKQMTKKVVAELIQHMYTAADFENDIGLTSE